MAANRLLAVLALFLATGAAASDSRPTTPNPDLLEFIGTFETAGGRDVDPLLLNRDAAAGALLWQKAARRPSVRKKSGKDIPPKQRETNDD